MNSLFEKPGVYSCAVDCFLEITRYSFLPFLAKLSIRSEFLQLLFNNLSQCRENNYNMKSLSRIREPVWLHLTENCSSFQARDCNACLSQIFEEKTFGNLNFEEASLFATQRAFDSYCQTCEKDLTFNDRIFLTYVTHSGLKKFGFDVCSWPLYVANVRTQPGRLICNTANLQQINWRWNLQLVQDLFSSNLLLK